MPPPAQSLCITPWFDFDDFVPHSGGDDRVTVDYADTYYENNGYGLGEDRAGVLMILDMTNRYNYLSTAGTMADYLNDHRIEEMLSSADDALYNGEYGRAMIAELTTLNQFLREGIEEGSFRYDAETGERLTGIYNKLTKSELFFAVICGASAALIMYLVVMRMYLLKGKTYHYSLGKENVRVNMEVDDEQFIRERVTRVPIVRSSGGQASPLCVHPAAEEVTVAEADAGPACTCPPAACLMEAGDITSDVLKNRSAQAACH